MVSKARWQEALNIQDAANLSGLVHSFPTVLDDIWAEARELNEGTEYVNTHPIVVLWLDKLCHLARIQAYRGQVAQDRIHLAYHEAHIQTTTDAQERA